MREFFSCHSNKTQGISIVDALVAIVITSILGAGVLRLVQVGMQSTQDIQLNNDRTAAQIHLSNAVDCTATLQGSSGASPGTLIQILGRTPSGAAITLVSNSGAGTKFGNLTLRAEISPAGLIWLRYARLTAKGTIRSTSSSDFVANPLTGQVVTWSSPNSLVFESKLELCSTSTTASSQSCSSGSFCKVSDFNGKYFMVAGSLSPVGGSSANYAGTVNCPTGTRAVGGGINCAAAGGGGIVKSLAVANNAGWYAECGGPLTGPKANQVYVICIGF